MDIPTTHHMKQIFFNLKALLAVIVACMLTAFQTQAQSVVETNGRLQVNGNRIVNQQGEIVELAGPSLFWSNNGWGGEKFYNASVVNWVKEDWNATIIRAAMGVEATNGYIESPTDNQARIETVVNAAIEAGIYVIIDFHSHDAPTYESQSKAFFLEMAKKYGSYPNVIFELFNEPLNVSWTNDIKPYAETIISTIRLHSQNLIIVGTPNWSQDVEQVIGQTINDSNTAYTLHFYAGTHFENLRAKGDAALNAGLALFVTEWGAVNADGGGNVNETSTNAWVEWMKANKLSHCNWALNDKEEGASALVNAASTTGGWSASDLTPSGALIKSIIQSYASNDDGGNTGLCNNATEISTQEIITIEAEDYCESYGVMVESSSEGGENIGSIDTHDWMTYAINIPSPGTYTISYRIASLTSDGSIRLEKKIGSVLLAEINIPTTGDLQTWQTISHNVQFPAGVQQITITAAEGGWNFNWFDIAFQSNSSILSTPTRVSERIRFHPNPTEEVVCINTSNNVKNHSLVSIYDVSGKKILSQKITHNQTEMDLSSLKTGIYTLQLGNSTQKLIKK